MKAVSGYLDGWNVKILSPEGKILQFPAEYVAYTKEVPKNLGDNVKVTREGKWIRLKFRSYEHRKNWVANNPCWEGDVSPLKRVMADHDIEVVRPRRCYLDIEWDSRVKPAVAVEGGARVLCWAVIDESGKRFSGVLEDDTDAAESALLRALGDVLNDFDQVCGWYSDEADRPVLEARGKLLGIKWDRRLHWMDQLAAFKRMNLQTAQTGDEKTSFSLNNIARSVLKEGKKDFKRNKTWDAWLTNKKELVEYCLQDADLLRKIEAKTGFLDLNFTICQVCHIFPNSHSLKPTAQMDGWFLRRARKEGKKLPTKVDREEEEQFEGAYVGVPERLGLLKDIRVVDFAAMYPSIIRTLNMSLETKVGKDFTGPVAVAPLTGIRFRTDVLGDIPKALEEFAKLRGFWKKKKKEAIPNSEEWLYADRQQNVYKVLMNSLYGVLGCPWSRFFDRDIAESVSTTGKWLIQKVNEYASSWN